MNERFRLTKYQKGLLTQCRTDEEKAIYLEAWRKQWECENSLDYTHDNLELAREYLPTSLGNALTETVHRLPRKVRKFVYNNCLFLSLGEANAVCCHRKHNQRWIILLGDRVDQSTVAHEIAHAWLGHRGPTGKREGKKRELDASRLAQQWGFMGSGTIVVECFAFA